MSTTTTRKVAIFRHTMPVKKPKSFEERQILRQSKKFRSMEEVYGPNFLKKLK